MAGGQHINVPCSHAAHLEEEGQRNYRTGNMANVSLNYIRVVESLFEPEYKEATYYYNPEWKVRPIKVNSEWLIREDGIDLFYEGLFYSRYDALYPTSARLISVINICCLWFIK